MRKILTIISFSILVGCQNQPNAETIIDKCITASGGSIYENSKISFTFREKNYTTERSKGIYKMERAFTKDSTKVRDILSNEGFVRYLNDSLIFVEDSMITKYSKSINSVFYFALLPYRLNDKAVNKKFLGEVSLENNQYYKIEVGFNKDGGGVDFEDVYIYWINKESYKIDYLAYSFTVNGGGYRFRKAYNERIENGVRFVDYINYKPTGSITSVHELDNAYLENQLKELSKIELKNLSVKLLDS